MKPEINPRKIVVLTGAGISAESGLSTFRDNGGLWCNYRVEDVATPEAWARDPEIVLRFYNERPAPTLKQTRRMGSRPPASGDDSLAQSRILFSTLVRGSATSGAMRRFGPPF